MLEHKTLRESWHIHKKEVLRDSELIFPKCTEEKQSVKFAEKLLPFLYYMSMQNLIAEEKKRLRQKMKLKRSMLPEKEYKLLSAKVCARIEMLPQFSKVKVIAAYYPVHGEVNILPFIRKMIDEGKRVLLPRTVIIKGHPQLEFAEVGNHGKTLDSFLESNNYG